MGLLLILSALALWIWWANRNDGATSQPESTRPNARTSTASAPSKAPLTEAFNAPPPHPGLLTPMVACADDVDFPVIAIDRDHESCAVCRGQRPTRFVTPRLRLCQWCVTALVEGAPFDITAMERVIWRSRHGEPEPRAFLYDVLNRHMLTETLSRTMTRLYLQDGGEGRSRHWLYAMRAYHLGLVARGVPLSRPAADKWAALAHEVRRQDGLRCVICGARNEALHVHHMIPLSEYGTNDTRNLATLCGECHHAQHPNHYFDLAGEDTCVD